jgi:ABC-type proline/glycine betaine transport systems, permease component
MLDYAFSQYDKLGAAFFQHVWMVASVLVLSLVIAGILTVTAMYSKAWSAFLVNIFSVIYSIPSLALFAVLIPVTGLGQTTAFIVLVLYNQYILLRNFIAGLNAVDPAVVEAATGMGMTTSQVLFRIRLPLSLGPLFAGIRLATISTIGIATIAASINAGGLGAVLFDGLRSMNVYKIVWGAILSACLAIGANWALGLLEKKITVNR